MASSFIGRLIGFTAAWVLVASTPVVNVFAREAKTITEAEVQQDGEVTRIILRGAEDPIYTAFMREDPPRLIIELPDVRFDGIETPMQVKNGLVEDVTLAAFGDPRVSPSMARITVGLERESEYELLPDGGELVIELRALSNTSLSTHLTSDVGEAGTEAVQDSMTAMAKVDVPAEAPAAMTNEVGPSTDAMASEGSEVSEVIEKSEEAGIPESQSESHSGSEVTEVPASAAPEAATSTASEALASEEASKSSSQILKVVAESTEIRVDAKGPIDNIDSFVLDNPSRLVADFWGAQNMITPAKFSVQEGVVQQVRIGQHPDKVRVVMDLRETVVSHVVEPVDSGVRIVIESGAKTAEETATDTGSIPAAPELEPGAPTEEASPPEVEISTSEAEASASEVEPGESAADSVEPEVEPSMLAPVEPEPSESAVADSTPADDAPEQVSPTGPVLVESVHFESLPGLDRVVLEMGQEVETRLAEPDPSTVVVDLLETRISQETERRVDTREFSGPLELFSVFQTPDVEGAQVRIVLKRSGASQPRLSWEGGRLSVELPHDGSLTEKLESDPIQQSAASIPQGKMGMMVAEASTPAAGHAAAVVSPMSAVPAMAVPSPASLPASPFGDMPLLGGPAEPAAIDVLEEGGFNEEKTYNGRRISLDFKDADIGNILRLIAEVSDLNIIAGEEVEGKVTIRLVDVPWDQAMDVVLMTKGLGFIRVGNVLRIAPIETLKLENEARLQERRAKEKLEDLIVKLQPVNYAAVREVKDLVQRLLSSRGSVNVDERTNTLIIKDIPSVIHEATALIKAIDTQTPQVLIEAKIVEASLNFTRSLGARWGVGFNAGTSDGGDGEFRLADDTLDAVIPVPDDHQQTNFIASNPVVGIVNGLLTLGALGFDDHLQLDLQLMAAEENNRGKVISSPRVVTLDNREAVIKQGVAIKFTEITRDTVTTSFVDAVLELKVTPHITANRAIIMDIKVSRNAPQLSTASGDVVGIAKNETETEALVRDGETMVLGGIYVVDNGKSGSKLPFLADIPLFGAAFKSKSITDTRRELLIFVTPRIVLGPASDV